MSRKLILAVVDGLGPALLDRAIAAGRAPSIAALQAAGGRRDDTASTYPSLTPVCLTALVTGHHPARSLVPSMTWYHPDERRMVEYGSSFAATFQEGTRQMMDDILVNLNLVHMSPRVTTIFEDLEDAGLVSASVNSFVHRGRVRHPVARPLARRLAGRLGWLDATYGPRRLFFGELYASDVTGAPRNFGGGVDRHGAAVARWLVTRDGFDFLFLYLYETDNAQHYGKDVIGAVEGADAAIGGVIDAAGGLDAFLERYAIAVVADHGQSPVRDVADPALALDGLDVFRSSRRGDVRRADVALAASNRVAMAYRLPNGREPADGLGRRLGALPAADVVALRGDGRHVVRRGGGELRFARGGPVEDARGNAWTVEGDADLLPDQEYPNALERIEGILACPRAGDVVVSAAPGWEFADAGGSHHRGGGSHGSLTAEDSLVPLVWAGFASAPDLPARPSITDVAPLARAVLGVGAPAPAAAGG